MNNLEPLIIELLKNNHLNAGEAIEIIKLLNKEDENKLSFKYETKNGSLVYLGIPSEIVKVNIGGLLEKVSLKKEDKAKLDKDDIIENILKIIK